MIVKEFSELVANDVYSDDDKKNLDPLTIIMVVNLVITIGKMIYECYKERSVEKIKNPNIFDRVTLKLMVMRRVGIGDFAEIRGNKLVNSMINQAGLLSEEDISSLLEESKNQVI